MEKFANLICSYRWLFISFIAILTCIFGYSAKQIKTDNSIEIWLKQDDPALTFYNKFKEDFGNEEFLLIAIDSANIFSKESIKLINQISSDIKKLKGISDVTSLATIFKQKIDTPYFKELLRKNRTSLENKENPKGYTALDAFKHELLNDPIYLNNVISKNAKTTAIIAMVEGQPRGGNREKNRSNTKQNWSDFRKNLVKNVKEIVENNINQGSQKHVDGKKSLFQTIISRFAPSSSLSNTSPNIHIAGPTAINAELDRMSQKDLAMFVPLMFCIALIVLIILLKKATGVIVTMISIGISNLWAMGLYAVCGNTMNMISGIITPVIFVIALATSIHIINSHYSESSPLPNNRKSIIETIKNIGIPCFFTCLTTSFGFLSLMSSSVAPVRDTGAFIAIGIMLSFLITIVSITLAFIFFDSNIRNSESRIQKQGNFHKKTEIFHNSLCWISSFVNSRTKSVLVLSIVLVAISIYGIHMLKVESDIIKAFPENSEIIKSNNYIEKNLTGLLPLEFAVISTNDETITDPNALKHIEEFQTFLNSINEVTFALSIVDVIKKVSQTMNNGDSTFFKIPKSTEKSDIYLNMASLYGGSIVDNFYTQDKKSARISARMKQVPSSEYSKILDSIKVYIKDNFPKNLSVKITGVVHLLIEMQDYLITSQIKSFSFAFAIIFIVMVFLLKSIKLALISMIPNIIPVIFTIGTMGYIGIMLDSGTMMVASVAIGIAVDDTIHFLYRFKKELEQRVDTYSEPTLNIDLKKKYKNDYTVSINQTIQSVGRAIIFTSIITFCGFLALCLSQFKPIQYFGLLTSITMINALIADLFVLPCALLIFRPKI